MPDPLTTPIEFPLLGVDTAFAPALQREGTTRVGTNVRSQDPFGRRLRGGSRPGLSRYVDERVDGVFPIQCLDVVVTQAAASQLYAFDQSADGPGVRIADWASSNFPDGPGATGPGGGVDPPTVPPFAADFNRRRSGSATVPQGGNGIMQVRTTAASPPPPPPPPGTATRTYTPFDVFHTTEIVGVFAIGPVSVPLTPPTDLSGDTTAVDYFGNAWNISLSAWAGTGLPTVAEVNALFVAAGWSDGAHPGGPYESSADS